jgi:hypothetical protein
MEGDAMKTKEAAERRAKVKEAEKAAEEAAGKVQQGDQSQEALDAARQRAQGVIDARLGEEAARLAANGKQKIVLPPREVTVITAVYWGPRLGSERVWEPGEKIPNFTGAKTKALLEPGETADEAELDPDE